MQVDPRYPRHRFTKECQVGVARKKQREAAVTSTLALRQQFSVHGDMLELFLDLKKAFDSMDRERCIMILEGHGAGPRMIRLIRGYWRDAIMVCRAMGNYGTPFKMGHGVTQGGPLSTKFFFHHCRSCRTRVAPGAAGRRRLRSMGAG